MYKKFGKRLLDIILSGTALVVLSPVLLVVAILVRTKLGSPVIFHQERVGLDRKNFMMYKFRSMHVQTDEEEREQWTTKDDPRKTKWGSLMRKTSIDELPQIYQVFVGKLSIVGPRPALWSQDDLVKEREKYLANDLKPGITGWAQVNGRDELEIEEKARLDGEYVKALNSGKFKGFAMDVKCFFKTFAKVLKSDGVVEGGTGKMNNNESAGLENQAESQALKEKVS